MNPDELKKYSIIVANGSGCLFQPMTDQYTYILTAKHLFFPEREDHRGEIVNTELNDGDEIRVILNKKKRDGWDEEEIIVELRKNINYFPHNEADIAILKINFIPNYNSILIENTIPYGYSAFNLCGCPSNFSNNPEGEKYTTYGVTRFGSSGNFVQFAEVFQTLQQQDIGGMSGGGIMMSTANGVYILGIQSKMATNAINQAGQIGIVPMKYFNDILKYPENEGQLSPFLPFYMSDFDLLKDEIIKLEGCIDPNFIRAIRGQLKLKTQEINLAPIDIIDLPFKDHILIHNENDTVLNEKKLWISWLEYLIILHIVKRKIIGDKEIKELFNEIRLVHSNRNEDWFRIMSDIFKTDFHGLIEGGVLIVSTNKRPSELLISKDIIPNIANVNPVDEFKTDNAEIHPLQQFKFIHIKAFEENCIQKKEDELQNYIGININELINKLKEIFDEILQS